MKKVACLLLIGLVSTTTVFAKQDSARAATRLQSFSSAEGGGGETCNCCTTGQTRVCDSTILKSVCDQSPSRKCM